MNKNQNFEHAQNRDAVPLILVHFNCYCIECPSVEEQGVCCPVGPVSPLDDPPEGLHPRLCGGETMPGGTDESHSTHPVGHGSSTVCTGDGLLFLPGLCSQPLKELFDVKRTAGHEVWPTSGPRKPARTVSSAWSVEVLRLIHCPNGGTTD